MISKTVTPWARFRLGSSDALLRLGASKSLQPAYGVLRTASLLGMGIGGATLDTTQNGELWLLRRLGRVFATRAGRPRIFDVGANTGQYLRLLWSVFRDGADICCFEPSSSAHTTLTETAPPSGTIEVFKLAFGDRDCLATLYADREGSSTASLFGERYEIIGGCATHSEKVTVRRLKSFCTEREIEHIDLLKLDVEGAEMEVLKGCGDLIGEGRVDFVQFEFGEANIASRTFFHDLFALLHPHYRMYRLLPRGLAELDSYLPKYEIFVSATNYLAMSRAVYARARQYMGWK